MPANIRETKIALAYKKQTDLATANVANDFWLVTKTNAELASVAYNTEPDNDIGIGTDFVTTQYKNGKDVSFAIDKPATSQWFAWAMAMALGKTTSTVNGGLTTYTSVPLVPETDGMEPPSFSYIEAIRPGAGSELFNRAMVGCVVNDISLTIEKGATRSASRLVANIVGTGKTIDANTIAIPGTQLAEMRLPSATAAITINGTNYVTGGAIESVTFAYNNNLRGDDKVFPGSGLQDGYAIGDRMEIGDRRTASLSFVARAGAGTPELAKLKNLTEGTAAIGLTGDSSHAWTATFHRVVFSSVEIGNANGIVTVQVNVQPMWHSTNGLLTAVTVTNQAGIGTASA